MSREQMTFDGEHTALFGHMWPAVPVFHRYDRSDRGRRSDGEIRREYTRCGRIVSIYDRGAGRLKEKMTWVPMRHALKFGRPCRRCFPDA